MKSNGLFGKILLVLFCALLLFFSGALYVKQLYEYDIQCLEKNKLNVQSTLARLRALENKKDWQYEIIEDLTAENSRLKNQLKYNQLALDVFKRNTEKAILNLIEAFNEAYAKLQDEKEALVVENLELKLRLKAELRGEWAGLRDFRNRAELFNFVTNWHSHIIYEEDNFDCTEFAYMLMRDAAECGFRLYPMVLFALEENHVVDSHLLCFAVVHETIKGIEDDWCYALEPQHMIPNLIGRLGDKNSWVEKWWRFFP